MQQTVLDNINSQPEVLRRVLNERKTFVAPFVTELREHQIEKVVFLGSGTSYNVSTIASYYFKHLVGMPAEAYYPTVFKNYESPDWTGFIDHAHILCVGVSQSGTSVSTCEAMEHSRTLGCRTLAITGDLESEITRHVDVTTHLLVGEELTPPETKGYTVSVLSVLLWAVEAGRERGSLSQEEADGFIREIQGVVDGFQDVLAEGLSWYERNKTSIVSSDRLYVLGYGVDYGSMLEGMLKVGEMLRVPTIGYEMEEYSHGPTMALKPNQTILMIGTDDVEFDRLLTFRKTYRKYTDRVHVITCRDLPGADGRDLVFNLKADKYLTPLLYTVPFQYLAARGAADIYIDTNVDPCAEPLSHYPTERV